MFVENYRLDTLVGGQAQTGIPYAKISDDDWPKWKAFLPVKSEVICKKELFGRPARSGVRRGSQVREKDKLRRMEFPWDWRTHLRVVFFSCSRLLMISARI
jgi:hypothetical protein